MTHTKQAGTMVNNCVSRNVGSSAVATQKQNPTFIHSKRGVNLNTWFINDHVQQDTFPASNWNLFDMPLKQKLEASVRSRSNWLTLVERYKKTKQQRLM